MKICDIFLIFAQQHRLWVHVKTHHCGVFILNVSLVVIPVNTVYSLQWYITDRSKAVLLLWFSMLISVLSSLSKFFVWVETLSPCQQFFSLVGTFSWFETVLSNEDEVSCSRTQHRIPGEIRTRDLAIKSPALYQLS